jgi:hypothetical protein
MCLIYVDDSRDEKLEVIEAALPGKGSATLNWAQCSSRCQPALQVFCQLISPPGIS